MIDSVSRQICRRIVGFLLAFAAVLTPFAARAEKANVFFIHGANVSENDARAWAAGMFKRLWQAGANMEFYPVAWESDIGPSYNYQVNASNAFVTASRLAPYVNSIYSGNYVLENNPISDTAKCLFEGVESSDWLSGGLLTLSVPYANHQYPIEELAGQSFSLLGTSVGLQEILAQHRKSEAQDKVVYDVYCCRVTICTDSLGGTTFNTLVDVGHSFWKLEIDPAHFDMIPVDLRRYACAYMGFYPADEIDNYVLSQEGALHYESQLPGRHDSRLEDGAQGTAKHTWFVTIDDLIAGLRAVHSLKNRSYNLAMFNCTDAALMVVNACGIGTNWSAMGLTYKSPLELYHAITAINGVVGGVE